MTKHIKEEYQSVLTTLYPTHTSIKEIATQLGLSETTVEIYARRLGLSRPQPVPWNTLSERDEKLIMNMYEYGDFNELSKLIGRSKHTISEWARKRGLKRQIDEKRNGDISILLDKSFQSFYWLGLLASDGYISKDGHLMFSQGEKDKDIVYSFAEYLKSSVYIFEVESGYNTEKRGIYRVNVKDQTIGKQLRELWGLKDTDKKTYSSISPDFIQTTDEAMAFLIGFFDGDGCLTPSKSGSIEVHSNWLSFLNTLCEKSGLEYTGKINKRGYATILIKKSFMIHLKSFIDNNQLIHNARKWNLP